MAEHTILVVEDSPTELLYFADLFGSAGYRVITAENGEQALRMARDEHPSLILLDVVMPGLSGFQVTRALTRAPETQGIPVVICTGKSTETDRIWGMRQGASDYVTKPVAPQELLERIARLLRAPAPPTAATHVDAAQ